MSGKNQESTGVSATAAQKPRFTLARLRQDCLKLFGVTSSTFDGATRGLTGDFTVAELRTHIDGWKKKKIPMKGGR